MAACWTLWLSGWEAACAEDFGSNGVAFTGAMDAAAVAVAAVAVAVTAAGALSPEAAFEPAKAAVESDGPLASPAGDNPGAASPTGPFCQPPMN